MPKTVVGRTVEGTPIRVARMDFWLPEGHNQERAELEVPTAWLATQTCPEHPLERHWNGEMFVGFTHYRASWSREWTPKGHRAWKPSVEFVCPRQHVWKVVAE